MPVLFADASADTKLSLSLMHLVVGLAWVGAILRELRRVTRHVGRAG